MNLHDLIEYIESIRFDVELSLASGFSVVQMILEEHETLRALVNVLRDNPQDAQRILNRIEKLLSDNPEPEFAHPHDSALTGYLYALNQVNSDLAQMAIEKILQTSNLWWARRLAEHIQIEHAQDLEESLSWHFDSEGDDMSKSPTNIVYFNPTIDISGTKDISVNKDSLSSQAKEYASPKRNIVDISADSESIKMIGVS